MDENPKFGLMVSLVLMNLTAIALFFLATPATEKQDIENRQHIQAKQVMVMAGDAKTKLIHEAVLPMLTNEAECESVLSLKHNMSKLSGTNPLCSTHPPDSTDAEEMPVFLPALGTPASHQERVSTGAKPPLAIDMKTFVRKSRSGLVRLLNGLKNGYTERRVSPEIRNKLGSGQLSEAFSSESDSQDLSWVWGPLCDGNNSNEETTVPTEIIMDVLSKTQKRTGELIEVFSKKVVPAIERMNDKVAEATRLEKNLDSYMLALISAIDSVICPSRVDPKNQQPGNRVIERSRHTKQFYSDPSLVHDSLVHDYVGSFSKEEHSKPSKRPVFKTLNAHCLHPRHNLIPSKRKRFQERPEHHMELRRYEGRMEFESSTVDDELFLKEPASLFETKNSQGEYIDPVQDKYSHAPANQIISQGRYEWKKPPNERRICIEDVLALTSTLEQNCDRDAQCDVYFKSVEFDFSSESSGMGMRRLYFIETPKHENTAVQVEEKSATLISFYDQSSEIIMVRRPELVGHLAELVQEPNGTMTSDCSIVCDSRIQGYDSYLAQRESSTIAQYHFGKAGTEELISSLQDTASKHSMLDYVKNTNDLVKPFKRLDLQGREVAMENVCLLVLKIFEAWSESQQPISPVSISNTSLSSWSSEDKELSENRPLTAKLTSTNDSSIQEHQSHVYDSLANHIFEHPLPYEQEPNPTPLFNCSASSTKLSRSLVQCADEAAEVQTIERSLKDLKTNHRSFPIKCDKLYLISPDNPSALGNMKNSMAAIETQNDPLVSNYHDSLAKGSKESSTSTFYSDPPESSEEAFYECKSTISAGTYSLDLKDSSKSLLEKIQEEETQHREKSHEGKAVISPQSSFVSIEPWLEESEEESPIIKEPQSLVFSENSSVDVVCGTGDEAYVCDSLDSTDESLVGKSQNRNEKKMKWGANLLKKFLKRKRKPSTLPITTSIGAERSPSDSAALKLDD